MKVKLYEIDHGIACRIGNKIFVNYRLRRYPLLYAAIINHELEHTDGYTMKDIKMDLTNEGLRGFKKEYYNFIFSNPSSWTEFLPCWSYEGKIIWNPLVSIIWGIALVIGSLIIWM